MSSETPLIASTSLTSTESPAQDGLDPSFSSSPLSTSPSGHLTDKPLNTLSTSPPTVLRRRRADSFSIPQSSLTNPASSEREASPPSPVTPSIHVLRSPSPETTELDIEPSLTEPQVAGDSSLDSEAEREDGWIQIEPDEADAMSDAPGLQDMYFDDEGLSTLEKIYLFSRSHAVFHRFAPPIFTREHPS